MIEAPVRLPCPSQSQAPPRTMATKAPAIKIPFTYRIMPGRGRKSRGGDCFLSPLANAAKGSNYRYSYWPSSGTIASRSTSMRLPNSITPNVSPSIFYVSLATCFAPQVSGSNGPSRLGTYPPYDTCIRGMDYPGCLLRPAGTPPCNLQAWPPERSPQDRLPVLLGLVYQPNLAHRGSGGPAPPKPRHLQG